jgi:hypothetical protein
MLKYNIILYISLGAWILANSARPTNSTEQSLSWEADSY